MSGPRPGAGGRAVCLPRLFASGLWECRGESGVGNCLGGAVKIGIGGTGVIWVRGMAWCAESNGGSDFQKLFKVVQNPRVWV